MLCRVKFSAVNFEESFGKYAMHVTESETWRGWQEIRLEDQAMLTSVLTNLRATEEQKANVFEHLSKKSAVVQGEIRYRRRLRIVTPRIGLTLVKIIR
jgi:hypothetical protein